MFVWRWAICSTFRPCVPRFPGQTVYNKQQQQQQLQRCERKRSGKTQEPTGENDEFIHTHSAHSSHSTSWHRRDPNENAYELLKGIYGNEARITCMLTTCMANGRAIQSSASERVSHLAYTPWHVVRSVFAVHCSRYWIIHRGMRGMCYRFGEFYFFFIFTFSRCLVHNCVSQSAAAAVWLNHMNVRMCGSAGQSRNSTIPK